MSATVSEQLPVLAAAPNGIKKLRELILELAVRGKLVAQDSSDEPANELVKRIVMEKARLADEGKKTKPLAAVGQGDKPFSIPDQWAWVRLGSCLTMINGRAFKPTDWKISGLPIVRIQNLNRTHAPFNYCDEKTVDDRHVIETGRLLISWSGTPGTSFGAFIWDRGKAALNQHIFSCFQIGNAFFDRFLKMAINTRLEELIAKAHGGVGLQHVTKGKLEALTLVLPPIAEQRRIVAKVDELMALCDRLEAQQADAESAHAQLVEALLGSLTKSRDGDDFAASWQRLFAHFHALFTSESSIDALKQILLQLAVMGKLVPQDWNDEPAGELLDHIEAVKLRLVEEDGLRTIAKNDVPEDEHYLVLQPGWAYCRLGNLARFIDYRGRTPHKVRAGVPLITAKNVRFGFISREPKEFIAEGGYSSWMTRGFPRVGDMLFTTEAPLGNIALVDISERFALAQRVICFQLHEPDTGPFLRLAIMSAAVQAQFVDVATGMTATGIKASRLKEIPIPIPPLAEQHRIVAKVDQLMALCDQLKSRLIEARELNEQLASAMIERAVA